MASQSLSTVRRLLNHLQEIRTTDPAFLELLAKVEVLLHELEADLITLFTEADVLTRAVTCGISIAAVHLQVGDSLHWQGTRWQVCGIEAADNQILVSARSPEGVHVQIPFANIEAVIVSVPPLVSSLVP